MLDKFSINICSACQRQEKSSHALGRHPVVRQVELPKRHGRRRDPVLTSQKLTLRAPPRSTSEVSRGPRRSHSGRFFPLVVRVSFGAVKSASAQAAARPRRFRKSLNTLTPTRSRWRVLRMMLFCFINNYCSLFLVRCLFYVAFSMEGPEDGVQPAVSEAVVGEVDAARHLLLLLLLLLQLLLQRSTVRRNEIRWSKPKKKLHRELITPPKTRTSARKGSAPATPGQAERFRRWRT